MVYLACLFSEQLSFPLRQWNVNALFADSKTAEEKITAYYMGIKMWSCEFVCAELHVVCCSWDWQPILDRGNSIWQNNVSSRSSFSLVLELSNVIPLCEIVFPVFVFKAAARCSPRSRDGLREFEEQVLITLKPHSSHQMIVTIWNDM